MKTTDIVQKVEGSRTVIEREVDVSHNFCGLGFDSIELDYTDVRKLAELPPLELKFWLDRILSRFK